MKVKILTIFSLLLLSSCSGDKIVNKAIGNSRYEISERINNSEQNAEKNFKSLDEVLD